MKALGIAIKLSLQGDNQFLHPHIWAFVAVVMVCSLTQMNYLNMVGGCRFGFCFFGSRVYLRKIIDRSFPMVLRNFNFAVNTPGIGCVRYNRGFSHILCHVHVVHYFGECHHVQGEISLSGQ